MTSDIALRSDHLLAFEQLADSCQRQFPDLADKLRKARYLLEVESFDDLSRLFLEGAGHSAGTYRTYLTAVRQLYQFTDGLNPLQITPADIERFHDHLVESGAAEKTRALKMTSLRQFFRRIAQEIGCANPFDAMDEKLKKKLSPSGKGEKKAALTKTEMTGLLKMLRSDESAEGLRRYSIVVFLYTTALRASEACSLRWRDLWDDDGVWKAKFAAKGDKGKRASEQEIPTTTMGLLRKSFRALHGRKPRPEDPVLCNAVGGALTRRVLWKLLAEGDKSVLAAAKAAGVIKREGLEFSPHLFRRTAGTLLAKDKANVVTIQKFLRHRNFSTTAAHYLDLGAEGIGQKLEGLAGVTSSVMSTEAAS